MGFKAMETGTVETKAAEVKATSPPGFSPHARKELK